MMVGISEKARNGRFLCGGIFSVTVCISAVGLFSIMPVAIAYRNTWPIHCLALTAVVTEPRRSMRRMSVITSDRLIESIWLRPKAGRTSSSIAFEMILIVDSVRLPFLNSSHSS
ncbi:hypothetical protein D3C80_1878940 [compost metagenome]